MSEMKPKKGEDHFGRLEVILPLALLLRIDESRTQMRREGIRVSNSSLVEIALEELLATRDLAMILRKRGASVRRS